MQTDLARDGGLVTHQPLVDDAVVDAHAIGHRAGEHRLAGRRAKGARPGVRHRAGNAVRREEAAVLVARDDHVLGQQAAVRELRQRGPGAGDHRLDAQAHAGGCFDRAALAVITPNVIDLPALPNAVGDDADVVVKVAKFRVKAFHAATAFHHATRRLRKPALGATRADSRTISCPGTITFSLCGSVSSRRYFCSRPTVASIIGATGCSTVVKR